MHLIRIAISHRMYTLSTNSRQSTRKTSTAAQIKSRNCKKLTTRAIIPIDPDDMLTAAQQKMCLALSYLDVSQLSVAKATDLITVIKQLFDITQVLQGKPTAITASNNRKALKDLIPLVLKEAERRGLARSEKVIEGEVVSSSALSTEGTRHTPSGASCSGPIQPSEQSEFSKIIDSL